MSTPSEVRFEDLFVKDIDKKINGVIKANDEKELVDEIDEYVLTDEIQRNLEAFLDDYNDMANRQQNGAWISGFFGSGKSHLLKMLSHILGEVPRELVDNNTAGEALTRDQIVHTFMRKAEDQDSHILAGELERTLTIPATSVLFNIDQKSDKANPDALLYAFIRVFYEARGYFGKTPYVAKFEHDLDNNHQLEEFKKQFEEKTGKPWNEGRDEAVLWDMEIGDAYAAVTGKPAQDSIIERYEHNYTATVGDFATDVRTWLDTQESNHRIVFLVDEAGQFIGENTELMLSLQSVAEDLAVKTNGRAWVVVTSQEDMDTIVGDRTKQQGYDFSKIQARFAIKLKLNSADVIEVVQKRLLTKKPEHLSLMDELWSEQGPNLRTMFEFTSETSKFGNNKAYDEDDFIASYPFVNYEFILFQNVLRNMSKYNMFDGRHASVGERSMLSAISSTLRSFKSETVGDLIPFDRLYDGISDAIQSTASWRINQAKAVLDPDINELCVRLLKVLLLVKHVDGFHATAHNLRILLTDKFGSDVMKLENDIQEALRVLEHDTYVQRVGDSYEYLTNEEQDVEQEIKNIDIDYDKVTNAFKEILVDDVIGSNMTVQYGAQKASFRFGLKIDQVQQTTQRSIWLNVVTSFAAADREDAIRATMGARDSITLLLDTIDITLFDDIRMYVKTNTYLKRTDTGNQSEARQLIIAGKRTANDNLYKELRARVGKALGEGVFYYNGEHVELKHADPQSHVIDGLWALIGRYYTNFPVLGGVSYEESGLAKIILDAAEQQPGTFTETNATENTIDGPADDVLSTVKREQQVNNVTLTVKDILTQYSEAPYGWPYAATLACIGHLYGGDRIELTVDGKPVQRTEAASLLRSTKKQDAMLVSIPRVYDAVKVVKLRAFAKDFLDLTSSEQSSAPIDLAGQVKARLVDEAMRLKQLRSQYADFAFVAQLDAPIEKMMYASKKGESWLLDEFTDDGTKNGAEELFADKENNIDPIVEFFHGMQYKVFTEGLEWLRNNKLNISSASGDIKNLSAEATALSGDLNVFRGNKVNQFKNLVAQLKDGISSSLQEVRTKALETVEYVRTNVQQSKEYAAATDDARNRAIEALSGIMDHINTSSSIFDIQKTADELQESTYPQLINELVLSAPNVVQNPAAAVSAAHSSNVPGIESVRAEPVVPARTAVTLGSIARPRTKAALESETDVDDFLSAYRHELLETIESGKKILL